MAHWKARLYILYNGRGRPCCRYCPWLDLADAVWRPSVQVWRKAGRNRPGNSGTLQRMSCRAFAKVDWEIVGRANLSRVCIGDGLLICGVDTSIIGDGCGEAIRYRDSYFDQCTVCNYPLFQSNDGTMAPYYTFCRTTYSTCTFTWKHVVIVDVAFLHNASLQPPHFTFDDPQHMEMKHSH